MYGKVFKKEDENAGGIQKTTVIASFGGLLMRIKADPKNLAENLMITDLCRNDLNLCCDRATVHTPWHKIVPRGPSSSGMATLGLLCHTLSRRTLHVAISC